MNRGNLWCEHQLIAVLLRTIAWACSPIRESLWTMGALVPTMRWYDYLHCRSIVFRLDLLPRGWPGESVWRYQLLRLFWGETRWSPCVRRGAGICPKGPPLVFQGCDEFCELSQARHCRGREGIKRLLQTWRNQRPRGPSCSHSSHLWEGIRGPGTSA